MQPGVLLEQTCGYFSLWRFSRRASLPLPPPLPPLPAEVVASLKEIAALGFLRQRWVRDTMELLSTHLGATPCNPSDPVDVAAFLWALELSRACVEAGAPMVAQ